MLTPADHDKLQSFVKRLGERQRTAIALRHFESTVTSYARILLTVEHRAGAIDISDDRMAHLAREYQTAGGRIYDAPGTPLRLLSAGRR